MNQDELINASKEEQARILQELLTQQSINLIFCEVCGLHHVQGFVCKKTQHHYARPTLRKEKKNG